MIMSPLAQVILMLAGALLGAAIIAFCVYRTQRRSGDDRNIFQNQQGGK